MNTDNLLLNVFNTLLKHFGKQNWWPAESKYEMIAGAILTQNTNWKNVEKALVNLKPSLNPKIIANMDNETLEDLIKPAGFFKSKANYLKNIFSFIEENGLDKLNNMDLFTLRNQLLSIKGVGKETADSILLYVFEKPIFIVDTYTKRLFKKLGLPPFNAYDDYRSYIEKKLPKDIYIYNEFHALIVMYNKQKFNSNTDPLIVFQRNN